jgi:hypothetical protein
MDLVLTANVIAMLLAIRGSSNFVREDFETGSWQFMVGNSINMVVGLSIGNIWLFIAQAALMFYTLELVQDNRTIRYSLIAVLSIVLIGILGVADNFVIGYSSVIDAVATAMAIYGAYAMSRQNWTVMAWCWILADIGFLYVAVENGLVGLAIQSIAFIYHGWLRVTGKPIKAFW